MAALRRSGLRRGQRSIREQLALKFLEAHHGALRAQVRTTAIDITSAPHATTQTHAGVSDPERATNIVLSADVDVASEPNASTRTHFCGEDQRA